MRVRKKAFVIFVLFLLLSPLMVVKAAKEIPPREEEQEKTEIQYLWWLLPWSDDQDVQCQVVVYHPDMPTPEEIFSSCGWDLYRSWINTPACPAALENQDTAECEGYYLMFVGAQEVTHTVTVTYPPPTVELKLSTSCEPDLPHYICPQPVRLVLQGVEFFPKAYITSIYTKVSPAAEVSCNTADCVVTLSSQEKDEETIYHLSFGATSSWGDRTPRYTATVRLTKQQDTDKVIVDVLSSQWVDTGRDLCAQAWDVFPPVPAPVWATTPMDPEALRTDNPYALLAEQLVQHGLVDSENCSQGGVTGDGISSCGRTNARVVVKEWQNRFDEPLLNAALDAGIPAVLFKRVIAHESQFWPGNYPDTVEVGFGHLSPQGADTLFLWDVQYFGVLCEQILAPWVCRRGYLQLGPEEKELLYNSLWVQANLSCSNCSHSLDLRRAPESLSMFAHLMKAHCYQTGQTVTNLTRRSPGRVTSYEDMWRFTLANYNGPNCIYQALRETSKSKEPLDWEHVSSHFSEACESVRGYVETILPSSEDAGKK